jgi:two-component system, LuxR family, sensor kinase FixL
LEQKGLRGVDQTRDIEGLVNEAMRQGYGLARGLNPVKLSGHGLGVALKELTESVSAAFHIQCGCEVRAPVAIGDKTVANHLYRIAQEAIHNAIKHGKAREIAVTLSEFGGESLLAIKDNGVGFPPRAGQKKGMGLKNMKARARMIGASLQIRAGESGGTEVTCMFRSQKPPAGKVEAYAP